MRDRYGGTPLRVDIGASVRPLIWWTFIYGLIVSLDWKGNSDRGLIVSVSTEVQIKGE